jgi:MFS family permease
MPVIARELHGQALFTLAFSGSMAISIVGMVAAGAWCDRRGPAAPLLVAVALFVLGLAIAGLAPTMLVLVVGRLVQGLGGGALTVALYVAVARWYPPRLHPLVFVGFSTAWVLPSLVGPFVAGVVTEAFGWRWVFLGVIVVALAGLLMIRRVLAGTAEAPAVDAPPIRPSRVAVAVLTAVAVLALGGTTGLAAPWRWVVPVLALGVLVLSLRPLMPRGTLRAAAGLPAVMVTRIMVTGAQLACEVYVPYLLIDHYGLSPAIAGLALTGGAVAWSAGSWLQGRLGPRASERGWVVVGVASVIIGVAGTTTAAALGAPPVSVFALWLFAGLGMGIALPRLSVLMIGYSTAADQGFNSSAQAIADAVGGSAAVAVAGVLFAAAGGVGGAGAAAGSGSTAPFVVCFALGTALALAALASAARVGRLPSE